SEFAADIEAFRAGQPVAVRESDATRRTAPIELPDRDATRRTTRPSPVAASSAPARPVAKPAPRGTSPTLMYTVRTVAVMIVVSVLYGAWSLYSDYRMYQHGQQLARDVESEQLTDLEQIWKKWTELSGSNPSSFLLYGPRKVVKQR